MVLFLFLIGLQSVREFFKPIAERSNAKPFQMQITFETLVKTAVKEICV